MLSTQFFMCSRLSYFPYREFPYRDFPIGNFPIDISQTEPTVEILKFNDSWWEGGLYCKFFKVEKLNYLYFLRALHVNPDKTKRILKPSRVIVTQPHHVWPSLTDEQWINVEVHLKDLILNDYAKQNSVNVMSLTQSEIRDIILGADIAPPSQQRQVKHF